MIALKSETKVNLEKLLELKMDELDELGVFEEIAFIEKNLPQKISFSRKKDTRKIGRGNPLLARKRMRTMKYVESRLDKLKW